MLVCNREEAARPAAGIIDGLAELRIDGVHHRPDHLARGEELAAFRVLFAHLEQQVFVHLRQGEEMGVVDIVDADLMHTV